MAKIQVLVVDDSPLIRRFIAEALDSDPDIEVMAQAADGRRALAEVARRLPDVITLDVEMPVLDGLGMLRELRKSHPKLPVIMFSTVTARGACATLDALALGANDYVTKPSKVANKNEAIDRVREQLIPKIKYFARGILPAASTAARPVVSRSRPVLSVRRNASVIAIGVSTGGPPALAEVLKVLPKTFGVPVLITQHMPPVFTQLLASRLNQQCGIAVCEASDGMVIEAGCAYIAPGGLHLTIERRGSQVLARTLDTPPENSCRPAVDVMFRSIVDVYGSEVLAVVMTGMGQDGLRGCERVRQAGGQIIIQDEVSSVVWGMPGAVARAQLEDGIYPLAEIGGEILSRTDQSLRSNWTPSPEQGSRHEG